MPAIPSVDIVPPLSDIHPLKQRCPSAMLDLGGGPPLMALHQDFTLKDGQVLPCSLPVHLHRLVERSAKAKSGHRESGGKIELPSCTSQHPDYKAPRPTLAKAESDRHSDPNSLHVRPLPSVLPSVKTVEGAPFQPPRPPGNSVELVPVQAWGAYLPGQGRASGLGTGLSSEHLGLVRLSGEWGVLLQRFWGPLSTRCPCTGPAGRQPSPLSLGDVVPVRGCVGHLNNTACWGRVVASTGPRAVF